MTMNEHSIKKHRYSRTYPWDDMNVGDYFMLRKFPHENLVSLKRNVVLLGKKHGVRNGKVCGYQAEIIDARNLKVTRTQ